MSFQAQSSQVQAQAQSQLQAQQRAQAGSHRLTELLDLVKQEFANVSNEASTYILHRDEFGHRLQTQHMNELQQVRKTIHDLERAHIKMKEHYEEEIFQLKRKLEARDGITASQPDLPQPTTDGYSMLSQPQAAQPLQTLPQPSAGQPPAGQPSSSANQPGSASGPNALTALAAGPQTPAAGGQPTSSQTPSQPAFYQPQASGAPSAQSQAVAPVQPQAAAQIQTPALAAAREPEVKEEPNDQDLGNNLTSLDIDSLPADLVKRQDEYLVVYNGRVPRDQQMDVKLVHSLLHDSVVCCVRFSLDGKYLATGCNRSAQIYDVATGQLLCRLEDESIALSSDLYIRAVCFSPDGKYLATGAEDKQIRVWDIASRKIRHLFSGHEQDIYSLDFSHNGKFIASGSGDRTVRLWDVESGNALATLTIEDGVTAVAISPDGKYVAAGSLDHIVRLWDTTKDYQLELLDAEDGHKDSVYSVAFSPSGNELISGSLDKTIKIWELQSPKGRQPNKDGFIEGVCARTITGHRDFVLSVATTPDSRYMLSGSKDRTVQFWNPTTGQALLMLQAHKNSVISVVPSPVGQMFATGSGDCWAKIWTYFPRQS